MNADDLLKIEQQGADFVRALIPHLDNMCVRHNDVALWRQVTSWRGPRFVLHERITPDGWRKAALTGLGWTRDYAFFAGAETAIREWEAATRKAAMK